MQNITVKGKEIRIKDDRFVIESENKAELVEFTVMDAASIEGLSDMVFYVQYRNELEEVGMDILEKDVVGDTLFLDWLPSASFTKERGPVEIQIIGFTQSLVTTSDATYQSGKLYFDADGNFIPVYPADSTHSPKVGDTITGTVKENQETGDDHRWSTMKVHLFLPEDIYENGTPVYTEAQVESLITQIQAEIALAQGYATSAATSATAASGSASAASGSASSANTNALKAEGFAVGQQGGTDVTSGSPYYHNNAKYYSDEASDSASAASASAGAASQSATTAVNAMIASVSETISPDDGGTNTITITYKDGTTKTFTVKNGKAGTPFSIYKTYASIAAMNADFDNVPQEKMVCISSNTEDPDNGKVYVRGESAFEFITDMSGAQGIQGPDGQAATIAVGTVSTGAAGSSATVTNSGTSSAAVFDFSIPKGDTGASGAAATIAVGTVTAGDDPSDASVTNSGTSSAAVFDFVLPKGETGNTPLLSIGDVTYGDTPTVTIDTTDPDNPVLDFVLKTSEVGVVDNLTSDSQVDALSAKQGKVLKGLIDSANSRINQHESRLENLEQKAGDYTTVQYRGTNAVPTGKASYGLVEKIVGKTRSWNQLCGVPSSSASYSGNGITFTDNRDGSYTVQTDANGATASRTIPIINMNIAQGRAILLGGAPSGSSATTHWLAFASLGTNTYMSNGDDIYTIADDTTYLFLRVSAGDVVTTPITFKPFIRDLNVIFPEYTTAQIVTLGMAGVLSVIPSLGQNNPYDAGSLVSTTVEGVEAVGVNIWDEEWEVGKLNGLTGVVDTSVTNAISSKNFIKVSPNTAYYLKLSSANMNLAWYDANYNYISGNNNASSNTTRTSPNNAMYAKLGSGTGYGNTYLHDIQMCLDSYSQKTTYHPYVHDTLSLPSVTLRSAGSVAEELDVETGEVTHPIRVITFDENTDWTRSNDGVYFTQAVEYLYDENVIPLCPPYNAVSNANGNSDAYNKGNMTCCFRRTTSDRFYIRDDYAYVTMSYSASQFRDYIAGKILYFALATPDPSTNIGATENNTIYTEGGGTINTMQTQTPVIDNSLDVGYLAV